MFDCIITNPPYLSKQMVYLKFLKKAQLCAHYVLGLHPVIPFLDQRDKKKCKHKEQPYPKHYNETKETHTDTKNT